MPLHTQTDAKETSLSFVAQSWKTVAQVYILFHTAFCLPVRNTFEANFYDVRALFACTLNVILWYFSVYIPELYVCTVVWDHRKNLFLNSQCWNKASQEEKLRGERVSFNSTSPGSSSSLQGRWSSWSYPQGRAQREWMQAPLCSAPFLLILFHKGSKPREWCCPQWMGLHTFINAISHGHALSSP